MQEINYSSLCIEGTRRCNMACEDCMRGDAQNIDISDETLEAFFEHVKGIGSITFTGGEPSLYVHAIRKTLEICKRKDIPVDGFYVATNGKEVPDEFLIVLCDWYVYTMGCSGENEMSGVALSLDTFHEYIPIENERRLRALSFFREDKITDFSRIPLIHLGKARELEGWKTRPVSHYDMEIERYGNSMQIQSTVLLAATGEILNECDYEYADIDDILVGNISNMPAYFDFLNERAPDPAEQ